MNHSNRIIIALCLVALTGFVVYFIYSYRKTHPALKLSSLEKGKPVNFENAKEERFIFSEKQPVHSIYGRVDDVKNNVINLTMRVITSTDYNPSNLPTYLIFTVHTDKKTLISRSLQNTSFIYKSLASFNVPQTQWSDVKKGNYITVYSYEDLRQLKTPEFYAAKIELPAARNVVEGRIGEIAGQTMIVSRTPPAPPWNPGENRMLHTVTVTDQTEISHTNESGSNQRDSFSDLKPGMRVRVYSFEDIEETDHLTAMRVEPLPALVIASPAPVVTPK